MGNTQDIDEHDMKVVGAATKAMLIGKRLEVIYDGLSRIVEVHSVGLSQKNKPVMRVWQVLGDSHSEEKEGWKLMSLGKVSAFQLLDYKSEAPRPGFVKGDKGMLTVIAEV